MKKFASILIIIVVSASVLALSRAGFISFKHTKSENVVSAEDASLPKVITFSENIEPVLSDNCYHCHGPDTTARKADLRLDRPDLAFAPRKDGQPVIIRGNPSASAMIKRITSKDPNQMMPPPDSRRQLTPQQIALLTRWVKEGAVYQEHWSFTAPIRPQVPDVAQKDWPKNPIDHFVLAKLEQNGLAPEAPADKRALIRRVSLDLIGLPPTPEEVENFVKDDAPNAYEKVVDRLLANPHYGEHEATYWLDGARYADTHGLHFDDYRSIWPYRDWVINALNNNERFDQFTVEQLAGDLLPNATIEQKTATGFIRCGVSTNEGGSIADEVLASYAKDNVETVSTVFTGLTMGCCACHDHKFDPITQKEFYQFSAFFRNTTQKALDGNVEDTPPSIRIVAKADLPRWDALPGEMTATQKELDDRTKLAKKEVAELRKSVAADTKFKPISTDKLDLRLLLNEGHDASVASSTAVNFQITGNLKWMAGLFGSAPVFAGENYAQLGNVGDFDASDSFSFGAWVRFTGKPNGALLARVDADNNLRGWELAFRDGKVVAELNNFVPNNALKVVTEKPLVPGAWQHVFVTYDGKSKAAGVKIYVNAMPVPTKSETNSLTETIRTAAQLQLGRSTGDEAGLKDFSAQDVRIYHRALSMNEVKILAGDEAAHAILTAVPGEWSSEQQKIVLNYYLQKFDPAFAAAEKKLAGLKAEQEEIRKRSPATLVEDEKPDAPFAYVLKRGQYDQPGEKVAAGTPSVLPPMLKDEPDNRLGLAKWLVAPTNPLLARVTVNRFWQQLFGIGIVRTSEDFGIQGDRPINQPLLDWLAVEFRESGWDVKHVFKLMVMSAAYQQDDRITAQKREKDPENRLVSRGPRFRLDGETIRDQALAVSGLLVPKIGGPPVKTYQPINIWEPISMPNSTTGVYMQDHGEALYRRSIYMLWKRMAPQPELETFGTPSRVACTVRRTPTNTPLQALVTMNDPQYVEAARQFAVNAIHAAPSPAARLDYMSEHLLARPLEEKERAILLASAEKFSGIFAKKPEAATDLIHTGETAPATDVPAPEQAAWTMVASQFFNLDEALNK